MISYSFVTVFENPSLDLSSSDSNPEFLVFSLKLGISYGTHPLIDVGSFSHMSNGAQHSIVVISRPDQSTLVLDSFLKSFDILSDISCVLLGTLSYQLYKLLYSSKTKKDWGNNKSLIRTTITLNPGISLRGLSRTSGLAMGSTQYWVRILAQENYIDMVSVGKSNHYFTREQDFSLNEKLYYSLIQNKRIYEILSLLNDNPSIRTQKALCTRLGYNKSLLSYYIKILKNYNIVESESQDLLIAKDFKSYLDNKA
ncbi:hypothetical protein CEE45_02215 [Candidatus Heimdallarchaeota archaeon B3_Heim]|nr:MAG: hypothetical protein CEE45_02215 [Candidatus Heimdallarchaeota archaeon B3_Heim]